MTVSSAATVASQVLSSTLTALKTVREQAQLSKDAELKNRISALYDNVLELKEALMMVNDENKQLRLRVAELEKPSDSPEIRQVGLTQYYFKGEKGPFCQPCYDRTNKLVPLMPPNYYAGGLGRKCEVCNKVFFENNDVEQINVKPFRPWS